MLAEATGADAQPAKNLRRLLDQKSDFLYGTGVERREDARKLITAAERLLEHAVEVLRR